MKNVSLLFVFLLVLAACSKNPEERGIVFFPDMVDSPAYEAFSESDFLPDGKTMLVPVKGSIARGKMPHPYSKSEEDSIKAGLELQDPYPETKFSLERGQHMYQGFCVACHGPSMEGDGPVISKKFPAPPSLKSAKIKEYSKGRIYHVISVGFGDMPAHEGQISIKDRWYIAQYIKQFQTK